MILSKKATWRRKLVRVIWSDRAVTAAEMPEARSSLQEDLFPSSLTLAQDGGEYNRNQFKHKLVFGLGSSKVFCGTLLLIFGLVSMTMNAAMASLASGVWAGGVGMATGTSGIFLTRCAERTGHVIVFLCLSILSVLTSGLATVFTATGIAHDSVLPRGYYMDGEGQRVLFAGDLTTRAPLLAIEALTLTSAIADCVIAVACCIVAAREACLCYVCTDADMSFTDPDSRVRHDRLVTWLGQQALMDFMLASGKVSENPVSNIRQQSTSNQNFPIPRPHLASVDKV